MANDKSARVICTDNATFSATLLSILRYVAALHACPYQRIFSSLSLRVLTVNDL